jgi:hypothetical protein
VGIQLKKLKLAELLDQLGVFLTLQPGKPSKLSARPSHLKATQATYTI